MLSDHRHSGPCSLHLLNVPSSSTAFLQTHLLLSVHGDLVYIPHCSGTVIPGSVVNVSLETGSALGLPDPSIY
jgi:hypothetical protein